MLRAQPGADSAKAYAAVWRTRGLTMEQSAQRWHSAHRNPSAAPLVRELRDTQAQLAQLVLSTPKAAQLQIRRQRLAALSERKEELEARLARVSAEFRRDQEVQRATPADLLRRMTEDSALVEIVLTYVWDRPEKEKPPAGRWHYEGFVLRPNPGQSGYRVAWVHLGEAEPIDQHLAAWRKCIIQRKSTFGPKSPEALLRKQVWDPLEEHLRDCKTVYIVPDGSLHFLPWAALPGRRPGTVLLEDYALATVSSGKQLYALLGDPSATGQGLLLLGDVAYDAPPAAAAPSLAMLASDELPPQSRAPALKEKIEWSPLKGTKAELEAIGQTWKGSPPPQVLQGGMAGERVLRRRLPGHRYLHLATHGFFADEKFCSLTGHDASTEWLLPAVQGKELISARRATATARSPLVLSGVVLAGANLPPKTDSLGLPTGEDGILTAEEIISSDLRGTELVVLSACETGLGKVAGGEGVYGLTRAFHAAGARNVVASLWKVEDRATAALMKVFYHKLWVEKKSPLEALREAQLILYRHPEQIPQLATTRGLNFEKLVDLPNRGKASPAPRTAPTRQWAGFILSGSGF